MNYLEYLRQPHYLAACCAVLSIVLAFAESKFSKQKYESKYYIKVGIIVFLNVFLVVQLIKNNYLQVDGIVSNQKGGGNVFGEPPRGNSNPLMESSTINPSNYVSIDTGNPNF